MTDKNNNDRFDILSQLARDGAAAGSFKEYAQNALNLAARYIRLQAVSLYLWDDEHRTTLSLSYTESKELMSRLTELETSLFSDLRHQKDLVSAYMTFGGETPIHSFTQPLAHGQNVFGAVIGIQKGERSTTSEDKFIETFCLLLSLSLAADMKKGDTKGVSKNIIEKARLNAIIETAVTVNHEVNNPLQAIIGNVQLLLMKQGESDEDLKEKLKAIEDSAMKITEVTKRLMQMTQAKTADYTNGTQMIDIGDVDSEDSPNSSESDNSQ